MTGGRVVVVGGGLAAARAVEGLRDAGFDGDVVLAAEEPLRPYERPPLTKSLLLGTDPPESVFPHDERWYRDRGIDLRLGVRALAIDVGTGTVALADGTEAEYDRLLLATGASPRRLPIVGYVVPGVFHVRRLPDALALREELVDGGRRVVVFGTGWIGMEVAAAARTLGNDVVVVGRGPVPLAGALGAELGAVYADVHREHGVRFEQGEFAAARTDADGRISAVELADGRVLDADVVVAGLGATPKTSLADAAGIEIGDGILTDAGFRTSIPNVFAVGDAAAPLHPFLDRHLRVDHWGNANDAGYAAGRSVAGEEIAYDRVPYVYSDQFELGMEWSGFAPLAADAELVVRGSLESREFIAFRTRSGRVVSAMNVNVWDVQDDLQALIASRNRVEPELLADPGVPLAELS
ncbi:NAD(P)/FAD-dependent oxidoreductase [Agromyces seonyuensis]|uniref:NAD(P)/FAD-dependent oxidoreductase n=1 Tax=Agromyces seonyuensis TaxID=2662446 RepID=A0A6I4NTF0_9MICO|nr:FAD-dependent oxidoreductase [Agromyces seonyuensis]MWB97736.1 NAD(P)/FAD-dependent oxidoreductase [Agromyces seonyuensis]